MKRKLFFNFLEALQRRFERALVQWRTRHDITMSMYIEAAPLDYDELWSNLESALDLIAEFRPAWIKRILQMNTTIHVRRIPGTRARFSEGKFIILDPYLLADFLPAQIAASIVHEATHAKLHALGWEYNPLAPARDERQILRLLSHWPSIFWTRFISPTPEQTRLSILRSPPSKIVCAL
jgi:hypothetical protein